MRYLHKLPGVLITCNGIAPSPHGAIPFKP
jgi:hypothetical protein